MYCLCIIVLYIEKYVLYFSMSMFLPSATSTMVTGPVGECLQMGTEAAPVLDCPAPLRGLHDFGAKYNYPDLFTH